MSEPNPPVAQLTPDQAERIRAATISNIVNKIKKGGTPTVAEQKLIEESTAGSGAMSLRTATCTVKDLAELFDYTPQRIDQLVADGIVVKHARGKYAVWESIRGLILHRDTKRKNQWDGDPDTPEGESYEAHRARLTKAKADIAEIEADLRKAQVHDAGAVMAVWADMISNTKAKLLSMPTTLAGRVHGEESLEEIRNLIDEAVNQALNELAEYDPSLATDRYVQEHSGSVEAAAEMEDLGMGGQPPPPVKRSKRRARAVENEPS